MNVNKPQILLVNDDGILSPGLWAAAAALSALGYVTVVAPRVQFSGAGRSLASGADGKIEPTTLHIGSQDWTCYAVGGSPAQAVQLGIFAILKNLPDLVVSGINYGENPATDITMSGTVGAALEAASYKVPTLAVSLELESEDWFGYSRSVDFSAAAHFTQSFARLLLEQPMPADVDLLNLNIPAHATSSTPWKVTRVSRNRYFNPYFDEGSKTSEGHLNSTIRFSPDDPTDQGSDVHTLKVEKLISVTPLSLDLTSRVDLQKLQESFGKLK